jgi:proline iminopeptidase
VVTELHPETAPYAQGFLDVGGGNRLYWETCGNPRGRPALVLHGGPGSGCTPWHRRLFDPRAYRIVLVDQRNCGRSTPPASDPATDLASNTTPHLVADLEQLRQHLGIERWLVLGGSWGSTLALAYAEAYPQWVTAMVLFGVTTGRHCEVDWLFCGGVAIFFPVEWDRLRQALPAAERDGNLVAAYYRRLHCPDPTIRQRAAEAWCLWESATPAWPPTTGLAERFRDPTYALAFARLVTHYMHHHLWLEDGCLLRGAGALAEIPGVLINGRFDFQAPLANAWTLQSAWPRAELVVVNDAGHAASHPGLTAEIVRATDRFGGDGTGDDGPSLFGR